MKTEQMEFKEKAKESINELATKIDQLEARKDKVKHEALAGYNQQLIDLQERKHKLENRFQELMNVKEDKWEEAKASFEKASDSLKKGYKELASMLQN